MSTPQRTILVAGTTGIAGSSILKHFEAVPDWRTVALSRRKPQIAPDTVHFTVDLTDRDAVFAAMADAPPVTHLAYAALQEQDDLIQGWREDEQMERNRDMLRNLLDALATHHPHLRWIITLQGGKAYGSHLGPVPVPAKERWPRGSHRIFYWQQEDLLRERVKDASWRYTILRPSMILGDSIGSPMSIIAALGVYAAITRQKGEPLSFPGGGRYVTACTDSRLTAQAVEWAFTDPATADETYNIVNGDVLVWQDIWPTLAGHFKLEVAEPRTRSLAAEMPRETPLWDQIVRENDLQPLSMSELIGGAWQFADHAFAYGKPNPPDRIVMSPIKARLAGFHPCYDTEDSIIYWLERLQAQRVLPY
jgi:nucleoside-diphosphate-sugar epimerase